MSLYRFVRLTALVALLKRYRVRVLRLAFACAFAIVTSLLYTDVASFLAAHAPQWSALALIIKTLIVYLALFVGFWEIRRMLHGQDGQPVAPERPPRGAKATPPPSPLDTLLDKPALRSRRDEILAPERTPRA